MARQEGDCTNVRDGPCLTSEEFPVAPQHPQGRAVGALVDATAAIRRHACRGSTLRTQSLPAAADHMKPHGAQERPGLWTSGAVPGKTLDGGCIPTRPMLGDPPRSNNTAGMTAPSLAEGLSRLCGPETSTHVGNGGHLSCLGPGGRQQASWTPWAFAGLSWPGWEKGAEGGRPKDRRLGRLNNQHDNLALKAPMWVGIRVLAAPFAATACLGRGDRSARRQAGSTPLCLVPTPKPAPKKRRSELAIQAMSEEFGRAGRCYSIGRAVQRCPNTTLPVTDDCKSAAAA